MDIWHIYGGERLAGSLRVQGSKNASLPILAAAILAPQRCELLRVPKLTDVEAALRILRRLGCTACWQDDTLCIDTTTLSCCAIPPELMAEMRSSVIFRGALLARCGEARLSLPGGCKLGKRPIDLHLKALRCLGAEIVEEGGELRCRASKLSGDRSALSERRRDGERDAGGLRRERGERDPRRGEGAGDRRAAGLSARDGVRY